MQSTELKLHGCSRSPTTSTIAPRGSRGYRPVVDVKGSEETGERHNVGRADELGNNKDCDTGCCEGDEFNKEKDDVFLKVEFLESLQRHRKLCNSPKPKP